MAGQGRPPHLKGEDESNIIILSSYHEGADPKSILLNGVVGDGLSNATLLNINGYIELLCGLVVDITQIVVVTQVQGKYSFKKNKMMEIL